MSFAPPGASERTPGFDLARAVAVIGMLLMHTIGPNYPAEGENQVLSGFVAFFHGRAAATFVVLAGVGLGLQVGRNGVWLTRRRTLLRTVPLLVMGTALAAVPHLDVAVILHFYAAYFLVTVWVLGWSPRALAAVGLVLLVAWPLVASRFPGALLEGPARLDPWLPDWAPYPSTLFFTGAYPVVPWVGFMFCGVALGKLRWDRRSAGRRALAAVVGIVVLQGTVGMVRIVGHDVPAEGAFGIGTWYPHDLSSIDWTAEEIEEYFGPEPSEWVLEQEAHGRIDDEAYHLTYNPAFGWGVVTTEGHHLSPLSNLAMAGFAVAAISGAVALGRRRWLEPLASLGRMALTFYVVHAICLSQSWVIRFDHRDSPGYPNYRGQLTRDAVFVAAFAALAWWWFRWFRRGPLEAVLDRWARLGERG